jgi:hypothetical protein
VCRRFATLSQHRTIFLQTSFRRTRPAHRTDVTNNNNDVYEYIYLCLQIIACRHVRTRSTSTCGADHMSLALRGHVLGFLCKMTPSKSYHGNVFVCLRRLMLSSPTLSSPLQLASTTFLSVQMCPLPTARHPPSHPSPCPEPPTAFPNMPKQ